MNGSVVIEIYSDLMSAVAFVMPPDKDGEPVTVDELMNAAEEAGVVRGFIEETKIRKFLNESASIPVSFIIAKGSSPGPRVDGMVQRLWKTDAEVNKSNTGIGIISVAAGDVIAKKLPPAKGSDGFNILGEVTPGEEGKPTEVAPGNNVKLSDDGNEFIATAAGAPKFVGSSVSVDPVYVINGDVCENTGNIKFVGALEIRGSVRDGFTVEAGGNIVIHGGIGAAEITSGGSVTVQGEIKTGADGKVVVEGNAYASKIEDSIVEAGRDVIADNGIRNSKVWCDGKVFAMGDKIGISGGDVSGYLGICATYIGDDKNKKTIVRAGAKKEFYQNRKALEVKLEQVCLGIKNSKKTISESGPGAKSKQTAEILAKLEIAKTKLEEILKNSSGNQNISSDAVIEAKKSICPGSVVFIGGDFHNISKPLDNATVKKGEKKGLDVSYFDRSKNEIVTKNV